VFIIRSAHLARFIVESVAGGDEVMWRFSPPPEWDRYLPITMGWPMRSSH